MEHPPEGAHVVSYDWFLFDGLGELGVAVEKCWGGPAVNISQRFFTNEYGDYTSVVKVVETAR
jgi:hypothetical protein